MHRWMLSILALSICVILSIISWIGAIEATEAKAGIHAQEVAERMQKNAAAQLESAAGKARTFIDSDWMDHKSQYQTLVPPSEIDFKLERRLFETPGYKQCGRILLYLPHDFARNGHGSQLNNYLLAAMLATYLDMAMVVLDAPEEETNYANGSQFGCPVDGFQDPVEYANFQGENHKFLSMKPGFPTGLSRLIQHPTWLSRDCPVPKCKFHTYTSWDAIRKTQKNNIMKRKSCEEEYGETQVTAMGGNQVRSFFEKVYKKKMLDRKSKRARRAAYDWAIRLGASLYEAEIFSRIKDEHQIWDYVSGLMGKSGILTFQPWIARDVRELVEKSDLTLTEPHDSIHVRRGDKLKFDSREEVVNYWHSQGYERQKDFPMNYIPFSHYLRLWESDCKSYWYTADGQESVRTIYIATDDVQTVRQEIASMPKGRNGTTIVGGCERVRFVFSAAEDDVAFHLHEGGVGKVDCVDRYKRNINSVADLMIVTKSNTFVGEFTSNWGRLVRVFRTKLNDGYVLPVEPTAFEKLLGVEVDEDDEEAPVFIKDIRLAFAEDKEIPPPGW